MLFYLFIIAKNGLKIKSNKADFYIIKTPTGVMAGVLSVILNKNLISEELGGCYSSTGVKTCQQKELENHLKLELL